MSNFESKGSHRPGLARSLRFEYRLRAPRGLTPFVLGLPDNFDFLDTGYVTMPCFERRDSSWIPWTGGRRKSLKDRILNGSFDVLTFVLGYMEMPVLIISCIGHVFFPRSTCQCPTCKVPFQPGLRGVAKKLGLILPVICCAPLHLPERLFRFLFPPPCNHNRCRLRNYISPPSPWYQPLTNLYQPITRQFAILKPAAQQEASFPFFELPFELRNQIYLLVCHANTKHTIEWGTEKHAQPSCSHTEATTPKAEYDASENSRQATRTEDATSYQLENSGILAIHGPTPPTDLLLINSRVYEEVQDVFWSTTEFEVQPLTPSDAWRRDYGLLNILPYARKIRKVRVRINVARFSMGTRVVFSYGHRVDAVAFEELELKTCCGRLSSAAEDLCGVLQSSLPMLTVVEMEWVDDFDEQVDGDDLQSRANVLVPFTSLHGTQVRVRRVQMPGAGRAEVTRMMRQVLDGL